MADRQFGVHKVHGNYHRVFNEWSGIEKDMSDQLQSAAHYMNVWVFRFFFSIFQSFFILQQLQNKYIELILIMLVGTDDCLRVSLHVGRNRSNLEKTNLPDLVTTWPSHMQRQVSNLGGSSERLMFTIAPVGQPSSFHHACLHYNHDHSHEGRCLLKFLPFVLAAVNLALIWECNNMPC